MPLEHLGLLHLDEGDYARAEDMWLRRIRLDSMWGRVPQGYEYRCLFDAQVFGGRSKRAEATTADFMRAVPESPRAAVCLELARANYDSAEAVARSHPPFRNWLRAILVLRGRIEEAKSLHDPAMPMMALRTQLALAWLDLLLRHQPEQALARLDAAVQQARVDSMPPLQRPYVVLVALNALAGRPAAARKWLNMQVALGQDGDPVSDKFFPAPYAVFERGVIALAEGRPAEATREIRAAANRLGRCPGCIYPQLSLAYEGTGQQDSVIAVLERFVTMFPALLGADRLGSQDWTWYPVALLRLAGIYEGRHDYTNAARHYRELIDLWQRADPEWQPYVARAREALARIRAKGE